MNCLTQRSKHKSISRWVFCTVIFIIWIIGGISVKAQQECPSAYDYWHDSNMQVIQDSVLDLSMRPDDPTTMYVGTTRNLLKSTDCGRSFDTLLTASRGFRKIYLSWENQNLITADTNLIKSRDGGTTWQLLDSGVEYGEDGKLQDFAVNAENDSVIYVSLADSGANNLYKSVDAGASWSSLLDTADTVLTKQSHLTDIAAYEQKVFVGDDSAGSVYYSLDEGQSWRESPFFIRNTDIGLLEVFWNQGYVSTLGKMYELKYDSDSLRLEGPSTPDSISSIMSIERYPCAEFITTDKGIYRKVTCVFKKEKSFERKFDYANNDSLPSRRTVALAFTNYPEDYMFTVVNTSRDRYQLFIKQGPEVGDIADEETPRQVKLFKNYPNPFNPSTNIRFTLPQASNVQLTVYNTIGQKVSTLVNQKMSAGSHSVTFDAGDLASGVYIYRLEAKGFTQSRKMLLVK